MILGLTCFESIWIYKNKIFSEMITLQCVQNERVVNFSDVVRIVYCALNIESAQPVTILTIEWTLKVAKNKKYNAVLILWL